MDLSRCYIGRALGNLYPPPATGTRIWVEEQAMQKPYTAIWREVGGRTPALLHRTNRDPLEAVHFVLCNLSFLFSTKTAAGSLVRLIRVVCTPLTTYPSCQDSDKQLGVWEIDDHRVLTECQINLNVYSLFITICNIS